MITIQSWRLSILFKAIIETIKSNDPKALKSLRESIQNGQHTKWISSQNI